MGILQKMLVKKDFYKLMFESPKRRFYGVDSANLQIFNGYVMQFIKETEDKINTCLCAFFYELDMNIKINKHKSNRSRLTFYNVDNPNEEYLIENGEIKATGTVVNKYVIDYGKRRKDKVEKIFRYYETIVSTFAQMSVPITSRIEFRYGFFEDSYFYLKAENNMGGVKIYRVEKEIIPDEIDCYYFNLDEIQEMFEKTIIPEEYMRSFANLKEFINASEQKVRDEVSLEIKRQESKQSLEDKLEEKFVEILEIEKELSETYGEHKRITITSNYLFETIDGVKYFKKKWLPFLPYINLSKVNLTGVDISGIDFSYANIKIDPQVVYNKDLRNCRFVSRSEKEWIFDSNANFLGCLLDGTYIDDAPVRYGINRKSVNLKIVNKSEYHN